MMTSFAHDFMSYNFNSYLEKKTLAFIFKINFQNQFQNQFLK